MNSKYSVTQLIAAIKKFIKGHPKLTLHSSIFLICYFIASSRSTPSYFRLPFSFVVMIYMLRAIWNFTVWSVKVLTNFDIRFKGPKEKKVKSALARHWLVFLGIFITGFLLSALPYSCTPLKTVKSQHDSFSRMDKKNSGKETFSHDYVKQVKEPVPFKEAITLSGRLLMGFGFPLYLILCIIYWMVNLIRSRQHLTRIQLLLLFLAVWVIVFGFYLIEKGIQRELQVLG